MTRLLHPGRMIAAVTLALTCGVLVFAGGRMFSPGALNADRKKETKLGGVSSHAELSGSCSACHASPWSGETMASRCLLCHDDVHKQIDSGAPLHGKLSGAQNCRTCHTEHVGPHGVLTSLEHFNHDFAAFKLTGQHASAACARCHIDNHYKGTTQSCAACHRDAIQSSSHKERFGSNCASCHTTNTWKGAGAALMATSFDHSKTGFQLTGKHQSADCKSCHKTGSFVGTSRACVSCHAEPVVHHGKFGVACATCHSTTNWKGATVNLTASSFDHDKTGFKLTGKHKAADCKSCHKTGSFVGTSQSCVSCHSEPVVHQGKFGVACATCHTTADWKGALVNLTAANFDHDKTKFKLTGKHQTTACQTCHKTGSFVGTSQSCVSCHSEPVVHQGKFGVACATCHSTTNWKGALANLKAADFDHDKTKFKLTGKHQTTDCQACHKNGTFVGTAQTCVSCHAEPRTPEVHKARYGDNCTACHTTTTFKNATFKHTFPINHGNRRGKNAMAGGNTCATCHSDALNMTKYTCYNCHVHDPARIQRIHANRKIANLQDCVKCHKTGRERADLDVPNRDEFLARLFALADAEALQIDECPACRRGEE